jgi:ribokinase
MASAAPRICVVGSANVDLTFRAPQLPRPGETLAGTGFQIGCGGKGANQAVMAARLGGRVVMVGRVGRDIFGEQTLANFREQGIDTSGVLVDEKSPTGTAAIVVDDAAQNCIVVIAGANGRLSPADVRGAAATIRGADMLLCQLEVPLETTLEALRMAHAAGVRTILNPAPAQRLPAEVFPLTSLLVPNETEAETLTGVTVAGPGEGEAAARIMQGWGVPSVIITRGDQGVCLLESGRAEHLETVAVKAVDPTGAGDAFIGSLAVFWGRGLPLRQAAARASAVAALSVTRPGTQTAFPTLAEVEDFWRERTGPANEKAG